MTPKDLWIFPVLFQSCKSLSKTQYHYNCNWDHRILAFNEKLEIFLPWAPVVLILLYLGFPSSSLVDFSQSSVQSPLSLSILILVIQSFVVLSLFLGDLFTAMSSAAIFLLMTPTTHASSETKLMNPALSCPSPPWYYVSTLCSKPNTPDRSLFSLPLIAVARPHDSCLLVFAFLSRYPTTWRGFSGCFLALTARWQEPSWSSLKGPKVWGYLRNCKARSVTTLTPQKKEGVQLQDTTKFGVWKSVQGKGTSFLLWAWNFCSHFIWIHLLNEERQWRVLA